MVNRDKKHPNECDDLTADLDKQYAKREKALEERADSVSQQEKKIDELVKSKVKAIEESALETAKLSVNDELTKLKSSLDQTKQTLKESNEREMALLNKEQVLNEKIENVELTIAQEVSKKTSEIRDKAAQTINLNQKENELLISSLTGQINDLKKKVEQGSQQVQGEILEEELASILRRTFPMDVIEDIAKGVKGGDLIQSVNNTLGDCVGKILWESKSTKAFSAKWIEKLESDILIAKADLGIILSNILPEDIKHIGQIVDGIWICDYHSITGLANALRSQLLAVAAQKKNERNRGEKSGLLYSYIISPQFAQRINQIVSPFIKMQDDLLKEKRAMQKIWSTREKSIEVIVENLASFSGDISGLIGQNLSLPAFEIEIGEETENGLESE